MQFVRPRLHSTRAWFIVLALCTLARPDCKPTDPTGHFEGTTVSSQAGQLNISLDLRCTNGKYEGELFTPVGVYTVTDGSASPDQLRLQLESGNDSVSVEAQIAADSFRGRFTSAADAGPVEMRRTGDARKPSSEGGLKLTPEQWQEDLRFFAQELPKRHANAFHHTTREQFDAAIDALKNQLDQLNGDQIYVALNRIANSIGDAHTYVDFPRDTANFPIDIHRFGDEYRVVAVGPGLEKALGTRVLRIDRTWIDQARQSALTITPAAETEALADARAAGFLTMGITLHGLGIIFERSVAQYTFADADGQQFTLDLHSQPPGAGYRLGPVGQDSAPIPPAAG